MGQVLIKTKMDGESAEDYISKVEAARIRAVSRQSIWQLVRRGRLRSVGPVRRVLVLRSEVEGFVELPKGRPTKSSAKEKAFQ